MIWSRSRTVAWLCLKLAEGAADTVLWERVPAAPPGSWIHGVNGSHAVYDRHYDVLLRACLAVEAIGTCLSASSLITGNARQSAYMHVVPAVKHMMSWQVWYRLPQPIRRLLAGWARGRLQPLRQQMQGYTTHAA